MRVKVLTIGTFDTLHSGHRHLFERAASHGDLTVGVNSDQFVAAYKGKPPSDPEDVRMRKVANAPGVSHVCLNDGPGADLIDDVSPDMLVIGSDWVDRDYLQQISYTREQLEGRGISLLFIPRIPGFSTTALRSKTFSAVVVTHANPEGAARMVAQLAAQTRPPDEIIIVATETPYAALVEIRDRGLFKPITTDLTVAEVGDWGHAKRERGLAIARCEWVGFFNDDDAYEDDYLEKMLVAATDDADVVFCEWNENPGCAFALYQSTAGNFIVRRELAQQVGWAGRDYEADGHFIEAVKAAGARVMKVEEQLYTHNAYEEVAA